MAKDRQTTPMSTAGITQYLNEYRSKIEFSPGTVIVMCLVVAVLVVAMHVWGTGALGLT